MELNIGIYDARAASNMAAAFKMVGGTQTAMGEQPLRASLNQSITVFSSYARIMVSLVIVDFAKQLRWAPTMRLRVRRLVPP